MMILFPRDVQYGFSQGAYLLLLFVPIALLLMSLSRYRQKRLADYAAAPMLAQLLIPRPPLIAACKAVALCLAWLLAGLALMDPKGNIHYLNMGPTNIQAPPPQEVFFLLDASASMGVKDGDVEQSRLEEAKQIIAEIVSRLEGEPVALSAFTSEVTTLVPSTMDSLFLRLVLKQVQINEGDVGGTDLGAALQGAYRKITERTTRAFTTVILISDGGDRKVESLIGDARAKALQHLIEELPHDPANLVRLLAIGVGSAQGGLVPDVQFQGRPVTAKLDEEILKSIVQAEEGALILAGKQSAWHVADAALGIIRGWASQHPARREVVPAKASETLSDRYYQIPLAVALLMLALVFFVPNTRFWALLLISLPMQVPFQSTLNALEDQGRPAMALFAVGEDGRALAWYEALLKETLPPWKKALVTYNIATIRLSQHRWDDALSLYRSISLASVESPLLIRYMQGNQALAYIGQAEDLPPNENELALYLIQQSLWHIEEALAVDCLLREKFENLAICKPPEDLKSLHEKALNLLHTIQQQLAQPLKKDVKDAPAADDPRALLAGALEQAVGALKLNGLVLAGQTDVDGATTKAVNAAQEVVLKQAGPFLAAVRAAQDIQFNKPPKTAQTRCARKPWEAVIAHFERGAQAAIEAKPRLAFREGLWLQEKTVWEWRKALESLQEGSGTQSESEPPPQQGEGSGTPASTQQLFRLVEEMVIEDTPNKQATSKEIQEW